MDAELAQDALERLAERAAAAHPELPADLEALSDALRRRLPEVEGPDALEGLAVGDLYLVELVLQGHADALRQFELLCEPLVRSATRRARLPASWADEVAQRLRARLLVGPDAEGAGEPRLRKYRGAGPLQAWLRVAALRIGVDMQRERRREQTLEEHVLAGQVALGGDPELRYLEGHYRAQFAEALGDALDALTDRERRVLKLRILDGLNIDGIGALHGVHRATAARWLQGAHERLGDEVRRRLRERLKVKPEELDSILRLVRSKLDLSLQRRLGDETPPDEEAP